MSTEKQKIVFQKVMKEGKSVTRAMRESGYSLNSTAKNPDHVTKSKAWAQMLDDYLSDEFLTTALKEDIENKPQDRKAELELAFKLKGKLKDVEKPQAVYDVKQIIIVSPDEQRTLNAIQQATRGSETE